MMIRFVKYFEKHWKKSEIWCENDEKSDKKYEKKSKYSHCDRWVIYKILKIKYDVKYFY